MRTVVRPFALLLAIFFAVLLAPACGDDTSGSGGAAACDAVQACPGCDGGKVDGECQNDFLVCPDVSCQGGGGGAGGGSGGAGGAALGGGG